ncbi:hypothetical protein ACPCSQ_17965 [Streptomyces griseoincarnatus]|uniref:hypothetical protein n=1 Tax=Streptomyces sp. SMS_SU21 TaxID=2069440 RepID=UPI000C885B6A|nr:hypothetical protein [Streptomyces sp. SMS_SU21]MCA2205343.1 hypothetical protein [Streptomyces sp. SMS_SU21]NEA94925.1 hypothetical protein [Actinospica acidiphila]
MKRIATAAVTVAAAIAATVLSAGVAGASDIGWPVAPNTTATTTDDIGWPVPPNTTADDLA